MFRKLYSALTSESSVDLAFKELTQMLEHGAWMFERANEALHSTQSADEMREPLYKRDRQINELERSIRRKVLRYLTVHPGHDVAICLALMSVAKDAERIGDYCKNVFEVGHFYREGFNVPKYQQPLGHISTQTAAMFSLVIAGVRDSNEAQARKALDSSKEIRSQCDQLIQELFRDEDKVALHEAVAYSLLARHYKRVAAHLAHIASAALGQLEELDLHSGGQE